MAPYPRPVPAQKLLVKEQKVPQFVLENPQTAVKNSLEFLKKMTVIAVSSIAFGRKLFKDEVFVTKELEGQHIQVLKGLNDVPASKVMVDWIRSALELINQQYLLKIMLVIEKRNAKTGDLQTVEIYILNFDYDEEQICFQLLSKGHGENIEKEGQELKLPADVATSVTRLLRSIDGITSKLAPLPDCEFGLRLELHEDTPEEVYKRSEMFKLIDSYDICFPSDVTKWKLGKIPTKFSTLTISAKSVFLEIDTNDQSPSDSDDCVPASQPRFGLSEELNRLDEEEDETHSQAACTELANENNHQRKAKDNEDLYLKALELCQQESFVSTKKLMEHLKVGRHRAQAIFNKLDYDGCFFMKSGRFGKQVDTEHLKNIVMRRYVKSPNTVSEEKEKDLRIADGLVKKRNIDKDNDILNKFQVTSPIMPREKRQKILGPIGNQIFDTIFSPEF